MSRRDVKTSKPPVQAAVDPKLEHVPELAPLEAAKAVHLEDNVYIYSPLQISSAHITLVLQSFFERQRWWDGV